MFCPKCGQQQVADDTRFCSRCGLPISGLAEWIAGGGLPAGRVEETQVSLPSSRRKRIRRGAKLMFLSGVLLPVFFFLGIAVGGAEPMLVPLIIFFVGLMLMLYARLFSEDIASAKSQPTQPSRLGKMFGRTALPSAPDMRVNSLGGQQVRTTELVKPPSVTEHTTKLLDRS